ncbi:hypothetical protein [Chitinibacter tainanensis]|uniref:hypothetical protein n=1 Tax=Chitinibacter tainanensis TaxID=230667 RepID=UPI00048C4000|nr:hypothetical protein [Chitinibacter tainanensis]
MAGLADVASLNRQVEIALNGIISERTSGAERLVLSPIAPGETIYSVGGIQSRVAKPDSEWEVLSVEAVNSGRDLHFHVAMRDEKGNFVRNTATDELELGRIVVNFGRWIVTGRPKDQFGSARTLEELIAWVISSVVTPQAARAQLEALRKEKEAKAALQAERNDLGYGSW